MNQLFLFFIFYFVGFFTAPVKGVYRLQFTLCGNQSGHMGVNLYKNNQQIMHNGQWRDAGRMEYVTNSVVLELTAGDEIHLVLPADFSVYDDGRNFSTFSGSLLFTL